MLATGNPMLDALAADGPAPELAEQMSLYGQFVGSWTGRAVHHDLGGYEARCDVHFGWVLDGRAVQDVWITPPQDERDLSRVPPRAGWFGTTLRVYDPRRDIWDVTWIDPATGFTGRMTGRRIGDDIVQEYRVGDSLLCQWCFTEITARSFHWVRRESRDNGATWDVKTEVFLERR